MSARNKGENSRPRATVRELALLADVARLTGDKERCEAIIQQIFNAYDCAAARDPEQRRNF